MPSVQDGRRASLLRCNRPPWIGMSRSVRTTMRRVVHELSATYCRPPTWLDPRSHGQRGAAMIPLPYRGC
jgi:hypothetical protein